MLNAQTTTTAKALEGILLFPFAEYWWFYAGFLAFVLLLLLLDLGVFHKQAHAVSYKEALGWSVFWIALSLLFNYGFYHYAQHRLAHDPRLLAIPGFDSGAAAKQAALEFLAGYVVEKSLSVDNIFVFVLVLSYFRIPAIYQHRVLFLGIIGALVFRAIFIALGALLMQYQWVLWIFGAFLVYTGLKMMFGPETEVDPEHNAIIKWFRRHVPVTPVLHGQSFFVKIDGKRFATPLLVTLLFVEMTDIVFAVDSVPAIFALTKEPLIVFTSNVFAILGLRALYFLLAGAMDQFHFLKYGLGVVLIFVGLKMTILNKLFHGHFPITWSLGIIISVIAVSIVLSLLFPKPPTLPAPPEVKP